MLLSEKIKVKNKLGRMVVICGKWGIKANTERSLEVSKEELEKIKTDKRLDIVNESVYTQKELEELTVPKLKELAREEDITGYSQMTKDELIDELV